MDAGDGAVVADAYGLVEPDHRLGQTLWKPALNAVLIAFADRAPAAENNCSWKPPLTSNA
jgi:hypothetical protein